MWIICWKKIRKKICRRRSNQPKPLVPLTLPTYKAHHHGKGQFGATIKNGMIWTIKILLCHEPSNHQFDFFNSGFSLVSVFSRQHLGWTEPNCQSLMVVPRPPPPQRPKPSPFSFSFLSLSTSYLRSLLLHLTFLLNLQNSITSSLSSLLNLIGISVMPVGPTVSMVGRRQQKRQI